MSIFTGNEKVTSTIVSQEAKFIGYQMTDLFNRDHEEVQAILPPKSETMGKARLFNRAHFAATCLLADLMAADFKVPLAARIVRRVMDAHRKQPEVEQWCVVHTANGNVSTLPYDQAELRTGFVSGSRLTFAMLIDLKTYADRVDRAIADAPRVIGGEDAD